MAKDRDKPHLRLVQPSTLAMPAQQSLFLDEEGPDRLMVVDMSTMSGDDLLEVLEAVRPRWVIDLRPVPTFDVDGLSRRIVFDLFRRLTLNYIDFAGVHGIAGQRDARLNPMVVAERLKEMLTKQDAVTGPVVILWRDSSGTHALAESLPMALPLASKHRRWSVKILP